MFWPAALRRSQACPELTLVTSLSCQPHLVCYPKKAVCLLEARQPLGLEGTG